MELINNGAVPEFVKVTVCCGDAPTSTEPKAIALGVALAVGNVATPLPLSVMVCGLPGALSVMTNVPLAGPDTLGVKVMVK